MYHGCSSNSVCEWILPSQYDHNRYMHYRKRNAIIEVYEILQSTSRFSLVDLSRIAWSLRRLSRSDRHSLDGNTTRS